jgi:photosystem II stability/assembly factor-like uncharacterized protein
VRKQSRVVRGSLIVFGAAIALWSIGAAADADRPETGQSFAAAEGPPRWVNIGPSPLTFVRTPTDPTNFESSGRVSTIAVHPTDPRRWLIGAGNGGVWESRDAGTSWVPLTDAAPTLAIGAVAFAPSNANVIYAATGEAASVGFAKAGLGMLKSTDGGRSWGLVGAFHLARASVRRVRIQPTNPDVLLVAASRGGFGRDSQEGAPQPVLAPPRYGILKSTDGGLTWVRTLAGQATALEVDPNSFERQYAAIGDQRLGVLTDSSDSAGNGIYRSTNAGESWSRVEGPWGTDTSPTTSKVGRIELAIAPSNSNVLYASIQVPPNGGSSATGLLGLYRTDNAWDPSPTWIKVSTDPMGDDAYCGPANCGYSHVISVDPGNPNTLIAGGAEQGLWRCTNCGVSPVWTNITLNSGVHANHHALAWAGSRLIDGNDGGVWSTTDVGGSWQNHNRTLSTALFFSGSLHPIDPNVMLGGIRGFQASIRGEDSVWTALPRVASGKWGEAEVAFSSELPDTDWMLAWLFGAIQRTTDGGLSGIRADARIDKTGAALVAPVRKCPTNDDVFVTGTNRMWRTNDFFSAAEWLLNGPTHSFASPNALRAPGTILAIAFAPSDPTCDTYAFGNRGGEIHLTTNAGGVWNDLDPSRTLPARPVNGIAFDPTNAETLYIALSSFNDATFERPGHVFKTENALDPIPTWKNVSPPIDVPFNVIAIDPRDALLVYAGSDTGLWRSSDGAATWVRMGPETGLPNVAIHDIQINPATDRTVVFTYGRGAFVLTTQELTLRPPTDLRVTSVIDNTVTIAFTAPSDSITPTGYVLEGGVAPGQVLASLPIRSTATTFTFTAPTGVFYIRVHSVAGSTRSEASNEIRIAVNQPPSAPANLLALVNGSSVWLAWVNTSAGGAPSRLFVDVTGSFATSLTLPVTESFSVAGVPAGTYTVALRAANGGGSSAASNAVTITVPGACSGAPGTPPDFVATKSGNVITVAWGLPISGPAPTGYTIVVTGSFVGDIPIGSRRAAAAAGPGSYTISIVATNPCGSSGATPAQTVTIP